MHCHLYQMHPSDLASPSDTQPCLLSPAAEFLVWTVGHPHPSCNPAPVRSRDSPGRKACPAISVARLAVEEWNLASCNPPREMPPSHIFRWVFCFQQTKLACPEAGRQCPLPGFPTRFSCLRNFNSWTWYPAFRKTWLFWGRGSLRTIGCTFGAENSRWVFGH